MIDVTKFPNGAVWIPAKESASDRLLVALHGSEGSANNFVGLDQELDIPSLNYLFLNGPIRSYSNYRWYTHSPQEAVDYLTQCFDAIARQGYPSEHTFLLGFSQGAALVFEFGVRYPHEMAGYIAMSGRIEDLPALIRQGNPKGEWLVTHGKQDYNLSIDIIRTQVQQMRDAGFRIDFQEFDKIHEFDSEKELPYLRQWMSHR